MSWVLITAIASLSQTLRSVFQKNLIEDVGVLVSAYSRFIFALPFITLLSVFFLGTQELLVLKNLSLTTWFFLISASICQILFTIILIKLFTLRSFAIGVAFSKTEVIQTTLLEIIIIGVYSHLTCFVGNNYRFSWDVIHVQAETNRRGKL